MRLGIAALVLAYVLSQFFRAFLAVLAPDLGADLGASPGDLALASGLWFLTFAACQIPVGAALDRLGPRRTASALLLVGGAGGAAIFALATAPWHVAAAMALIGAGCSPVLMSSYLIFARSFPPAAFATLAGATVGAGSLGNVLSAAPLLALVEAVGWRPALWGLAGVTALAALVVALLVRDPPRLASQGGSVADVARLRALWPILAMMFAAYGPVACIRGLWAGPYAEALGGSEAAVGWVTLAMGLAMVAGNFLYGPADRWLGTRKGVVLGGNALVLACLLVLAFAPLTLAGLAAVLMLAGVAGSSFPMVVAHARAFVPAHLTGRGVTLVNMFGIGGAGLMQVATRPLFEATGDFRALFLFFALIVAAGLLAYLPARDRLD